VLKSSTLNYEVVLIFQIEVIIKCKSGFRVMPSCHLSKPEVAEYQSIIPVLDNIKSLRKFHQLFNGNGVFKVIQQMFIAREKLKMHIFPFVKYRPVTNIISRIIFQHHKPIGSIHGSRSGEISVIGYSFHMRDILYFIKNQKFGYHTKGKIHCYPA